MYELLGCWGFLDQSPDGFTMIYQHVPWSSSIPPVAPGQNVTYSHAGCDRKLQAVIHSKAPKQEHQDIGQESRQRQPV